MKAVSNYLRVGEFSLKLGQNTVIRVSCHKQTGRVNHGVWPFAGKQISRLGDPVPTPSTFRKSYSTCDLQILLFCNYMAIIYDCSMVFHPLHFAFEEPQSLF